MKIQKIRLLLGMFLVSLFVLGSPLSGCSRNDADGNGDGDSDGDGDADGDSDGDYEEVCTDFCELVTVCEGVPEELADCISFCEEDFDDLTEECRPLLVNFHRCVAELSCEDWEKITSEEDDAPCKEESQEWQDSCFEPVEPLCSNMSGAESTMCEVDRECDEDGDGEFDDEIYEIDCTVDNGCVCQLNGVEVARCDDFSGICSPIQGENHDWFTDILPALNSCCGWDITVPEE